MNKPGMTHRQLVNIAPFTASSSGKTTYTINAIPIVWNDSIMKINRKWDLNGTFHDLKKHIRAPRISAPNSGTANAIKSAHIHAIRSSSGSIVINVLSRPYKHAIEYIKFSIKVFNFFFQNLKLTKSLLQYDIFRSLRTCDVIKRIHPLEITPPASTMTNVIMYAMTLSIFTDIFWQAWLAIEPLSVFCGGSRNTSHPLVSCTVRWLNNIECVS